MAGARVRPYGGDGGRRTRFGFAGFVVFSDPPKASAGAAIAALGSKGVGVKILSGDNERVTQHVCAELGIPITGVMTGAEIEALSE